MTHKITKPYQKPKMKIKKIKVSLLLKSRIYDSMETLNSSNLFAQVTSCTSLSSVSCPSLTASSTSCL